MTKKTYIANLFGGPGCHARGQGILMYDGSVKRAEDVAVGDFLMGPDSQPREVLKLCKGRDKMVRIVPTKGAPFVVNVHHVLSLRRSKGKLPPYVLNVSVQEYISFGGRFKSGYKLYRSGLIDFPANTLLPLDPYILGTWLGDGTSEAAAITTADEEVLEAWESFAASVGHYVHKVKQRINSKAGTYYISTLEKVNTLTNSLKELGVWGNKHIPHPYLVASRAARLALLAGLLDTDGYREKSGCYEISSKWEHLAQQVAFLCRSLGYAAYITKSMRHATNTVKQENHPYWAVHISGNTEAIPCRVLRKRPTIRRQKKSVLVTGFKVEEIEEDDFYGFFVDGDHLYLLDDFTVTHNSGKSTMMAAVFAKLKFKDVDCEMAPEFAKDLVWEGRYEEFGNQAFLFGNQCQRLRRLEGKVDVIITDSPLLLSLVYNKEDASLNAVALNEFRRYNNLNYFLVREKSYNPNGRVYNEEEAAAFDTKVEEMLVAYSVPYIKLRSREASVTTIAQAIYDRVFQGEKPWLNPRIISV